MDATAGFNVVLCDDTQEALRALRADVAMVNLRSEESRLLGIARRTALLSEYTSQERLRLTLAGSVSKLDSARIRFGAWRQSRVVERMVQETDGVQCNGYPTFDAWRDLSPRPLLFLDSRLHPKHLPHTGRRVRTERLRLGFSGRFIPIKGAVDAARAVAELSEAGIPTSFTVFGEGPLEAEMRAAARGLANFTGSLRFDPEWIQTMPDHVDLMLLPHTVGDPSGTFLESAGLGVPVLGYRTAALSALVDRHGIGWTVPLGDVDALVSKATELWRSPSSLEKAGDNGTALMSRHHFAASSDARAQHLIDIHASV
ncbi:hypothetical protein GCM10027425_02990 [Alteromonas gracilis]